MSLRSFVKAAALTGAAAVVLAGCGGGSQPGEPVAERNSPGLKWDKAPLVFISPNLPEDRVVYGWIRNPSDRTVELKIEDLRVLSGRGESEPITGRFLASFTHRLQPYNKPASELPLRTRLNSGLSTRIPPGGRRPLTASWRQQNELERIVEIDYGSGRLPVPPPRQIDSGG